MCRRASALLYAGVLLLAVSCTGNETDGPTGPADLARGGAAPLTAAPSSLALSIPAASGTVLTASVQYSGTITATTSSAACATVNPLTAPATKPRGSSLYVATFTVTPVGAGSCTITLADKRGATSPVPVVVRHAIPTDGTKLVVLSDRDGTFDLYLGDPDGTDMVRLTNSAEVEDDPVLSPDRSRIAFASNVSGTNNIYLMNADGSGRTQLTFFDIDFGERFGAVDPAFSPDGSQIAFSLYPGFGGEGVHIHVVDAVAGTDPVQITAGSTVNTEPGYAPDGRIVFTSRGVEDLWTSIWIMFGNGASPTRLTSEPNAGDGGASVSPDGSTIAFARGNGVSDSEIWLMDIDGTNERVLTANADPDGLPVFRPGGEWLAFVSRRSGAEEVIVMKLDRPESEAWNITSNSGRDLRFDWK